ncbi:transmembrane protein (plasmid) [Legionella adelaidensis]|uniref:Ancillary SecYEG translocon subunit n=1 Tax=Legionella adelaidensis TaxID=45056 RepID=A0A0W0R1S5_9GAMM|nr:tetratricopeptide repeat protein [Legionella adelaidensis]KTC64973.1 transmembrane protein [Legionella adelaidensis]VEH85347.1 transmembrane protein [Legionella adelaidensis]
MSVYMTEQEQIEAIKKWWQRYNGVITVIASLILLAIAGYKYWNWHQAKVAQEASNAYEHLIVAFSNQDNKGVRAYANQLLKEYNETVYADAARLTLAKLYTSREKYQDAITQLDYVAKHSKMTAFQQVAKIRMARILIADKSYDKALSELSQINDTAYSSVVNEIKGDVYAETGKYFEAIAAYRKAINEVQTQGMGNVFLEMKTNELAALTQSMQANSTTTKPA